MKQKAKEFFIDLFVGAVFAGIIGGLFVLALIH